MKNIKMIAIVLCLVLCDLICAINITDLAFGKPLESRPVAFGDFNSDKLTDIFILKNLGANGMTLQILISSNEPPLLQESEISCDFPSFKIYSVVPGDFDGDGSMDAILVTIPNSSKTGFYEVYVLYGDLKKLDCKLSNPALLMKSQPLLLDFNGDMIADLFGNDQSGNRTLWLFNESRDPPTAKIMPGSSLRKPSSHGFVDLNQDFSADIWVCTENQFEIQIPSYNGMVLQKNVTFPKLKAQTTTYVGQTSFGDFDLDGDVDVLLPVCSDVSCSDGSIFVYDLKTDHWFDLKLNIKDPSDNQWKFPDTSASRLYLDTITLRVGDYNLDGYPDILVTLVDPNGDPQVVLLENSPCSEDCEYPRALVPKWSLLEEWKGSVLGTFFDFEEDGSLDILLVQHTGDGRYVMGAFKNSKEYDAMFVKVLVATGRCLDNCVHHTLPYGTNQPGVAIHYSIVTGLGGTQTSRATQLSQSAHMALQLPYSVFGLSRNWNFVETLTVGIPKLLNTTEPPKNTKTFTQIIPNSQVIVIPYPPNKPSLWINQLFITPSKALKMTAGALIATCLFVAGIIAILHYRERQQDRREKLQESQRFHFDAM